jgi:hypothetical protein
MRFLFAVIATANTLATEGEMERIDVFNDRMREGGHLELAVGISNPSDAVVVDNRANAGIVTEGPLHDLPEWMAGMWVFNFPNADTARREALEASLACNRKIEVRALL